MFPTIVSLPVAVGLAIGGGGCNRCGIDRASLQLAGPGAVQCGRAARVGKPPSQDSLPRDAVRACAVAAFKATPPKPFIAVFTTRGFDNVDDLNAMVRDPQGDVYYLHYSAGPFFDHHLVRARCVDPRVIVGTPAASAQSPKVPWQHGFVGSTETEHKDAEDIGCGELGPMARICDG